MKRLAVPALLALSLTACADDMIGDDAELLDEDLAAESSAAQVDYPDIGVIPKKGMNCPGEMIRLYIDNEDKNNNNSTEGYIGDWRQDNNTDMRFCRVSSKKFTPVGTGLAYDNYAVLKLDDKCPAGSSTMIRYFDNEDEDSFHTASGDYAPSKFGGDGGHNLWMHFCVYKANTNTGTDNPWPGLNFGYGVFTSPDNTAIWRGKGWVYIDDEDHNNKNTLSASVNVDGIIEAGDNTKLYIAEVH